MRTNIQNMRKIVARECQNIDCYKKIREGFEGAGLPMPKVENFCGGVRVSIERTKFIQMMNVPSDVPSDVTRLSQALSQVLSQLCPKLDVSHYPDATAILIALYKGPQSLKELMEQTKEKNRGRIKENVLQHLCDTSFVEPTIKDVPNSPKQKYALTDKGRKQIQAMT